MGDSENRVDRKKGTIRAELVCNVITEGARWKERVAIKRSPNTVSTPKDSVSLSVHPLNYVWFLEYRRDSSAKMQSIHASFPICTINLILHYIVVSGVEIQMYACPSIPKLGTGKYDPIPCTPAPTPPTPPVACPPSSNDLALKNTAAGYPLSSILLITPSAASLLPVLSSARIIDSYVDGSLYTPFT